MDNDLTTYSASGGCPDYQPSKVAPSSITTSLVEYISEDAGTLNVKYTPNSSTLELSDNDWEAYGCNYSTHLPRDEVRELYGLLGSYLSQFDE